MPDALENTEKVVLFLGWSSLFGRHFTIATIYFALLY